MLEFRGIAHRVENLGEFGGIRFVNDSKATTIESVRIAVKSVMESVAPSSRLHLLVGGKDKDLPWRDLGDLGAIPNLSLLFFGAKNAPGDIVIVLRGPNANATLRRKERVAGMWMMVEQEHYSNASTFYRIAATQRLQEIMNPAMMETLGIGSQALITELTKNRPANQMMDNALIQTLASIGWVDFTPERVDFLGDTVFRSTIRLPNNLPRGHYIAELFLIHEGQLISSQTLPIIAKKQGIDAWISKQALEAPWLYGIGSVLLALMGGWLGNRLLGGR
jgi:uncharacterized protein (TIGR02186 family)